MMMTVLIRGRREKICFGISRRLLVVLAETGSSCRIQILLKQMRLEYSYYEVKIHQRCRRQNGPQFSYAVDAGAEQIILGGTWKQGQFRNCQKGYTSLAKMSTS
jgi:hypothetical protein